MNSNDLALTIILAISFGVCSRVCYTFLWFRAQEVFDIGGPGVISEMMDMSIVQGHKAGFISKFYSHFSISSRNMGKFVRVLFASTFALCLVAVELTLWQILVAEDSNFNSAGIGAFVWLIDSVALGLILILVQPFLILLTMLNKFYGDRMGVDYLTMVSCALILTWIYCLTGLNWGPFGASTSLLTKVSVIGVSIMATLSGVASLSTPYYVVQFFWQKRTGVVSNTAPNNIRVLLLDEVVLMEKKRECDQKIQENLILLRKVEREPGGTNSVVRQQLVDQISTLQLDLAKLEQSSRDPKFVRLLKQGVQLSFLVYCVYKLLSTALIKIPAMVAHTYYYPNDYDYRHFGGSADGSTKVADPLAVTLSKILNFLFFRFKHQEGQDFLVKQISMILSVSLFGCSVSTVVTTVSYLTTLLPHRIQILALRTMTKDASEVVLPKSNKDSLRRLRNPSVIKNLLISELTGIYVLATILMIRSNLPMDVNERLNRMLGASFGVPNVILDVWFDKMFAVSSLLTFVGIRVAENRATNHYS
ncbi:LADA_0F11386g1_1 [Lachancea dasiensis]|uniref:LADA_0F11386g1_1 n=1 Tax=Lachancea dasiensis TaxID=1072105 RepID=A0A1G4JM33_9SACH|nr:LADA_0F11386g1_1 [Lachancea dasiensis]